MCPHLTGDVDADGGVLSLRQATHYLYKPLAGRDVHRRHPQVLGGFKVRQTRETGRFNGDDICFLFVTLYQNARKFVCFVCHSTM